MEFAPPAMRFPAVIRACGVVVSPMSGLDILVGIWCFLYLSGVKMSVRCTICGSTVSCQHTASNTNKELSKIQYGEDGLPDPCEIIYPQKILDAVPLFPPINKPSERKMETVITSS